MGSQQGMVIPFDGVHHVHQSSPGKGISAIGVVGRCIHGISLVFIREMTESGQNCQKNGASERSKERCETNLGPAPERLHGLQIL